MTLVGSSPEVMVRVIDGQVTVRPLAGTRRRGATEEEDLRLAEELLADPKERAEHVMLVDLGRNDVGRVCRYRSRPGHDVMTIERYSHVMHITSNVSGELAAGKRAFDALQACLPAGTVPVPRRSAPWKSSTNWSRIAAVPMPAPWASRRRRHRDRRCGSDSSMISMARTFGAPDTVPAGRRPARRRRPPCPPLTRR